VRRVAHLAGVMNPNLGERERAYIGQAVVYWSMRYGLRWEFVTAVIAVESRFRIEAVSKSGAMGLGQLMPETAQYLRVSNAFDIWENVRGTVAYLREQVVRFRGRTATEQFVLALAAYNAGPNAVKEWGGVPPNSKVWSYIRRVANFYRWLCKGGEVRVDGREAR